MENTSKQAFKLHLPGLLRVLAEHLYSNKQVALRELIQNAHDSCTRRALQAGTPDYRPCISVRIEPERRKLIIEDNGSGLTEQEINDYLATIGRSYTRELKNDLAVLSPDEAARLIGQFGFGFLSAFLLASEVTLTTRSWQAGHGALRWTSAGDEYYEVAPAERAQIGTTIELEIKPAASFALRPNLLIEAIQQYADFLPTPIYVGDDPTPINLMTPPWEAAAPDDAIRDYIARVFKVKDPLCIIRLEDYTVDMGHDRMTVPLRGFVFVPPGSIASVREYGDLIVYIRRMFICRNQKDLLPPWARFVRGVIDCQDLQPTASREDIHQDETFYSTQQAIEEQLAAGLRRTAGESPDTWRQIVQGHTDVIMGWAVQDDSFFEQVADIVTLRTSRGYMTLPEYSQLTDGVCYYVTRELGSLQEQLLAEGYGVPVIDASWFAVSPFLHKYAARYPKIQLARLDGDATALLRPVSDPAFSTLLDFFDRSGVTARMAAFQPNGVPALMLYPEDAERIVQAREALESEELPDALASLIGDYVTERSKGRQDLHGTLYLNVSCPLIRKLSARPPGLARDAVLSVLYQNARLFAARTLSASDAATAFERTTAALEVLLK